MNNTLFDQFKQVDKHGSFVPDKTEIGFSKCKKTFNVGCIYKVRQVGDDRYQVEGSKFAERWDDVGEYHNFKKERKDSVTKWSSMHWAAINSMDSARKIKKLTSKNPTIENILEPLKEAAKYMTRDERKALLAYMIQILTKF